VYLLLSAMYFVLCFGLSRFAYWLEKRQARRDLQRPDRSPTNAAASAA
jgi:polar amino acid transport system permease protein